MATAQELTEQGFALAREGKLKKAMSLFEKAYQKDPGCVDALYGQGAVHYKSGNHAIARGIFSRVLDASPTHERATKYLHRCDDSIEKSSREHPSSSSDQWDMDSTDSTASSTQSYGESSSVEVEETSDSSNSYDSDYGEEVGSTPAQAAEKSPPPQKKSHKLLIINLAILLFVIVAGAAVYFVLGKSSDIFHAVVKSSTTHAPSGSGDWTPSEATGELSGSGASDEQPGLGTDGSLDEDTGYAVQREGSVFSEILAIIGAFLVVPTFAAILISAYQEGILKGLLFLLCCFYQPWYMLVEYKDENKWLYIGINALGGVLLVIARHMGSDFAVFVFKYTIFRYIPIPW